MILYHEGDTIAAESTPAGRGGISLVRLSGPAACKIASTLFDRSLPIAGRHSFGKLIAPDSSRTIDEA
ncbi:MAG: tRNA uridine-5-carboxymethylaminomethyl(34) synthesis GTPase MnmE, partial [Calditrichaeota bacterium]|nr:tRNA uridine-5-carboxymethylaminomethyl(34) synthesis GTPase MnmE [Calditrichota bacterium]